MVELPTIIKFIFECTKDWLEYCFHPVRGTTRLLAAYERDSTLDAAYRVWLATIVLSVITVLPLYNLFGISWNNYGFYLVYTLLLISQPLAVVFCFHLCLRLFGLASQFQRTLQIYTIVIVYLPLSGLINALPSYEGLRLIQSLRQQSLSLEDALISWPSLLQAQDSTIATQIITYCSGFVGILSYAAMTECVVQIYRNQKWKTYFASGISLIVALVPSFIVWVPAEFITLFSFLQPH